MKSHLLRIANRACDSLFTHASVERVTYALVDTATWINYQLERRHA